MACARLKEDGYQNPRSACARHAVDGYEDRGANERKGRISVRSEGEFRT